jgi:hypothetical protein
MFIAPIPAAASLVKLSVLIVKVEQNKRNPTENTSAEKKALIISDFLFQRKFTNFNISSFNVIYGENPEYSLFCTTCLCAGQNE